MPVPDIAFREANLWSVPIRELKLSVAGTRLEPILEEFQKELERVGITRLKPRFYLSTEWGVPFGTIAIAIPFYLARDDLVRLHAERSGHVEGTSRADILRYLRHEMGHVVNYAYRLYEEAEWIKLFGAITQPYLEQYRPQPFSRRFVRHLPGWYAQKHPDEDWAETFAVWMSPHANWHTDYADWPTARTKLEYCDRIMADLNQRDPPIRTIDLDQDVGDLAFSLEQYYRESASEKVDYLPGLDGALRAIFDELQEAEGKSRRPASALLQRHERELMASVYQWTGHFPEHTRRLLRHLAARADALELGYPEAREPAALVGLTALVTALAMNYTHGGTYLP